MKHQYLIAYQSFNNDVISSVRHYIYKGKVVVPYDKLKSFLEIALEIYIGQQYIPKRNDHIEFCQQKVENYYKVGLQKISKEQRGCCINIRNGMNIEKLLCHLQQSVGTLNFRDKRYCRCGYEIDNDLGNLMSQSGFRQRQSLLRDIFIETYSQNGNSNGLRAGVLAISNEHYRSPTSVLLTNDNGKHPSASHTNTSESMLHRNPRVTSTRQSFKPLRLNFSSGDKNNEQDDLKSFQNVFDDKYKFDCTSIKNNPELLKKSSWSHRIPGTSSQLFPTDALSSIPLERQHSLNISHTKETSDLNSSTCNIFEGDIFKDAFAIETKDIQVKSNSIIAKTTILNEVLQSPWRPRQPSNYKPFRKKFRNFTDFLNNHASKSIAEESNHKNNNRDSPIKQAIDPETKISIKEREYKCSTCDKVFTSSGDYDVHMRRHLSVNRYSCVECHKTFSQLRNFKYHMSIHRGTKEFATTCPVCGKYFNDRGYLSSHMKIHRNRKEYKCPSCPKSFNQRVAYNMHVRIHTGVKPHICEECGKAFSRKMLLKQHQRTHSGERPYACTHCGKCFADRSNMTLHLRLHTGIKPFSCTMCSKSFTKKHHLKAHLNFHTGAKPYSCPRCQLSFTQSSNMRTHYKKCSANDLTT